MPSAIGGNPAAELPVPEWFSRCQLGSCVEVGALPDRRIAIRNSTDPAGVALIFPHASVEALFRDIRTGRLDALLA